MLPPYAIIYCWLDICISNVITICHNEEELKKNCWKRKNTFTFNSVQVQYTVTRTACVPVANIIPYEIAYVPVASTMKILKSSMARIPQMRIYNHFLSGQVLTTCSNATELAQWTTHSFSRPQPDKDNGVRDDISNWLDVTNIL